MHETATDSSPVPGDVDIIFECPKCGKSLEIDARGAGFMIVCPDCRNEIQVPAPAAETDDGAMKMDEIVRALEEKIVRFERQQTADENCFRRLADEIALIQAALDRITSAIESRKT